MILAIFDLQVAPIPPIKSTGLLVYVGHLGFLIGMILAIFDPQVITIGLEV